MSNINGVERIGVPLYHWEHREPTGYHINGARSAILETRVLPALSSLPEGALVADFGCGEGRLKKKAPHHTLRPYVFRGYEINPEAVGLYNQGADSVSDRAEVADLTELNIGADKFDAALFWRVLHSIPVGLHSTVLGNIAASLKPGASLHVAVRSARDWVADDLKSRGLYRDGEMNECFPAMEAALAPGRVSSWPLYFFRPGELVGLGERTGLTVVHQGSIEEPSGYRVLRETRPFLSYDYVEFVKP